YLSIPFKSDQENLNHSHCHNHEQWYPILIGLFAGLFFSTVAIYVELEKIYRTQNEESLR
ncbi:MAG: hypothetical protein ACR2KX_03455, partial [Chitinophagaceae bacterium]